MCKYDFVVAATTLRKQSTVLYDTLQKIILIKYALAYVHPCSVHFTFPRTVLESLKYCDRIKKMKYYLITRSIFLKLSHKVLDIKNYRPLAFYRFLEGHRILHGTLIQFLFSFCSEECYHVRYRAFVQQITFEVFRIGSQICWHSTQSHLIVKIVPFITRKSSYFASLIYMRAYEFFM